MCSTARGRDAVEVPAVRLDDTIRNKKVQMMKIDVEGAEVELPGGSGPYQGRSGRFGFGAAPVGPGREPRRRPRQRPAVRDLAQLSSRQAARPTFRRSPSLSRTPRRHVENRCLLLRRNNKNRLRRTRLSGRVKALKSLKFLLFHFPTVRSQVVPRSSKCCGNVAKKRHVERSLFGSERGVRVVRLAPSCGCWLLKMSRRYSAH